MDIILKAVDNHILTPYRIYPEDWTEDSILRQFISLFFIVLTGGYFLYFLTAGFSYAFLFDKRLLRHPLILKNQVWKEIKVTCASVPLMGFLETCCFLFEVRGYSKLHERPLTTSNDCLALVFNLVTFILFTDCLIYWIHRGLHSPFLYKSLHKTHHLWKVPTPFASHAFHPIDGFAQSSPYHLYVFLFPMHKYAFLGMFLFVNIWTVSIHDGDFRVPRMLKSIVNGSAHHTDHHLYYNYNYGQFFTFWDRIGSSFRHPSAFSGNSPLDQLLKKSSSGKTK